uniref:Parasitism-specific protein PSP24 n=1 Tax=Anastrepha suspensa TaxID=28587 RepID=Q9U714_9MUSC|nr:parasitism-specific protein PSP24 [Anastrepha suspensa]
MSNFQNYPTYFYIVDNTHLVTMVLTIQSIILLFSFMLILKERAQAIELPLDTMFIPSVNPLTSVVGNNPPSTTPVPSTNSSSLFREGQNYEFQTFFVRTSCNTSYGVQHYHVEFQSVTLTTSEHTGMRDRAVRECINFGYSPHAVIPLYCSNGVVHPISQYYFHISYTNPVTGVTKSCPSPDRVSSGRWKYQLINYKESTLV